MLLLKTAPAFAYAKVDKADAEEVQRLRAQYLIHKVLEESVPAAARSRSSRPPAMARVKARIGVRLKKLRLAVRGARVRACRTVQRHLRRLRRLLVQGSGEPAASPS